MRKLTISAILALSALGIAQSPLQALTGGTNQGNVGGGMYFDLQINTTVTITQIDFLCGANTLAGTGTLNVFLGPSTYLNNVQTPALWAPVGTATTTVGPSTVATGLLTTPFALAPGTYGISLQSNGFNHGYTNGVGCTSNTTPGSCSNSVFTTNEMVLRGGAAQNAFLSGTPFTPRIFNGAIHYTLGGTPVQVAAWQPYGTGCYARYRSFYQNFPNPVGLNLGNTGGVINPVTAFKMSMDPLTGGYSVTVTNTPVVTPVSTPVALTGPDQTFTATSVLGGSTLPFAITYPQGGAIQFALDLEISTDGYIVPSPNTMANDASPTIGEFLSGVPRWCPHWKDMTPTGAGSSMHVEMQTATGPLLVTWNNVLDSGGLTTASTFQVAFFQNGDVEYRYGVMSQNGGGTYPIIIGWTDGNGALDPGNIEIATALPFKTFAAESNPLTLSLGGRPLLGTTATFTSNSVPSGSGIGVLALGFTKVANGTPLAAIGMPDCFAFMATFDATATVPVAGTSFSFPLQIPNMGTLNGGLMYAQALSVSPGVNQLGLLSSNGVQMKLGSL